VWPRPGPTPAHYGVLVGIALVDAPREGHADYGIGAGTLRGIVAEACRAVAAGDRSSGYARPTPGDSRTGDQKRSRTFLVTASCRWLRLLRCSLAVRNGSMGISAALAPFVIALGILTAVSACTQRVPGDRPPRRHRADPVRPRQGRRARDARNDSQGGHRLPLIGKAGMRRRWRPRRRASGESLGAPMRRTVRPGRERRLGEPASVPIIFLMSTTSCRRAAGGPPLQAAA
jgi:hypothetical protein